MYIINASIAQTKIVCNQKEQKSQDSESPILIKTCIMGNYQSISEGVADPQGRYSYSYKLSKNDNGKYIPVKNSELFNEKKVDLLYIINQRIKKTFDEYLKDPENRDCFNGVSEPNATFDDLGITFNDFGIDFNISFGLPMACMAIDGTTVSFKIDEITTYLNQNNDNEEQLPFIKANASGEKYVNWSTSPVESQDGPTDMWTMPSQMCEGPSTVDVKASTTLAPQGKYKYSAQNICDDDPTTAWVEGNLDYGIGEYLEINNWSVMGNGEISILNGYQSSKSSWENNSRVKKFKVSLNGKDFFILELADVMGAQRVLLPTNLLNKMRGEEKIVHSNAEVPEGVSSINDGNGNISFTIGGGGKLRFTIIEVYPGLKYKDTAISGIFSCGG